MIKIALTKKQIELDHAIKHFENVFYGGAKGGGKSVGMRYIMLKGTLAIPGLKAVIFRKTYPELYNNHISVILEEFPQLQQFYNAGHKEYRFPNGSVLAFRYNQLEKDLSNHQGVEYHWLGIEEAGEWPEDWFWKLKGSNRSSNPNIKPRCLLTGNPGGIGHKWLKRLFVDKRYRKGIEREEDFYFIPAKVTDNPALMDSDPGYVRRLKANKNKMLVKAYLDGSWDIQAGQFFDGLNRNVHLVRPFAIPDHWERQAAFDTGYNHPAAFLWGANDSDGNVYIYREYNRGKRRTEEIVQDIMEYKDSHDLQNLPAGLDCWTKHGGGPSVSEKFYEKSNGKLILTKAKTDRIAGAAQIRDYLALNDQGKPRLYIFDTCTMLFDTLMRMTHDPKRPEDVLKVDAVDSDPETGDDLYDCLRYYLMNRPRIAPEIDNKQRDRYNQQEKVSWEAL